MTEQDLRFKVIDTILAWEGATRGSPKYLDILNTYNLHQPLARGYALTINDSWCAATVSAAWIKAGVSEWTGTECSCARLIEMAKERGIWVENDTYTPKVGDAILYDWDDGANYAKTDNTGAPEHIGIVVQTGMGAFEVIEGNKGTQSVCGRRVMAVNGRYIRGFICPDYARYAVILTERETPETTTTSAQTAPGTMTIWVQSSRFNKIDDMPEWARAHMRELCKMGALQGGGEIYDEYGYPADLDLSLDMIRTLIICKRIKEA